MEKLVCINIDGSLTQRDNVKSFYQSQVKGKKVLLLHKKDVLLDGTYVEFFHQGQVDENLFLLLHPW